MDTCFREVVLSGQVVNLALVTVHLAHSLAAMNPEVYSLVWPLCRPSSSLPRASRAALPSRPAAEAFPGPPGKLLRDVCLLFRFCYN